MEDRPIVLVGILYHALLFIPAENHKRRNELDVKQQFPGWKLFFLKAHINFLLNSIKGRENCSS